MIEVFADKHASSDEFIEHWLDCRDESPLLCFFQNTQAAEVSDAMLLGRVSSLPFVNQERGTKFLGQGERLSLAHVEFLWELVNKGAVTYR
jgi:hypothetical protein